MLFNMSSAALKKKRKQHHQILPYKSRRFKETESGALMIVFIVLLASCRIGHCSVISSYRSLAQMAPKEVYLQSLRQVLHSQMRNISAITTIDKFNLVNETEFATKYEEYLRLVQKRREQEERLLERLGHPSPLPEAVKAHFDAYQTTHGRSSRGKRAINNNDLIYMHFDLPLNMLNDSMSTALDEAYLTLHLKRSAALRKRRRRFIKVQVFQLTDTYDRIWLDTVNLTVRNVGAHKKIRLNVQRAVSEWMRDPKTNLGLQVFCENCHNHGIYVVHDAPPEDESDSDFPYPTLRLALNGRQREKRHRSFRPVIQDYASSSHKHVKCSRKNEKCCRRQLKVHFKELSGLDFVIQPKVFDAGFCEGTCPTAYNPAHEHAVLQSRLADLGKPVPRPCCAPSILSDVDVLHVDEEDSTKLKVTTFKNMRVLQCACS